MVVWSARYATWSRCRYPTTISGSVDAMAMSDVVTQRLTKVRGGLMVVSTSAWTTKKRPK